jgi:hypothetical protein
MREVFVFVEKQIVYTDTEENVWARSCTEKWHAVARLSVSQGR